jgi:O-acetyl-ADP-ribose deacetylase
MLRIEVMLGDIFDAGVDAIVNPANRQPSLRFGSHINERIRKNAGPDVVRERREKGPIALGEAVYTTAGRLPFRYIIHAAVLDLYDLNPLFLLRLRRRTTDDVLHRATARALLLAAGLQVRSVAFSPMGAGVAGMPMRTCAQIMLDETMRFAVSHCGVTLERVVFVVQTPRDRDVFEEPRQHLIAQTIHATAVPGPDAP